MRSPICGIHLRYVVFSLLSLVPLTLSTGLIGEQPKQTQLAMSAVNTGAQGLGTTTTPHVPTATATLAKTPEKRLPAPHRMAALPVEFFPVPDPDRRARFMAGGAGYSLILGDASLLLTSSRSAASEPHKASSAAYGGVRYPDQAQRRMQTETELVEFVGAAQNAKVEGLNPTSTYANFYIGNDPGRWRSHMTGYERVRYTNLYPGIDLVYHGELHNRLEYDLAVAPGADTQQIRLRVSGDHEAQIGKDGSLELDGPDGLIRLDAPVLYQNLTAGKTAITGGFVRLARNEFGFRTETYDKSKQLIIDPTINLLYSTYLGGRHEDDDYDLELDANGNTYLAGQTASQDFPVSGNAYQTVRQNIGTYTYDGFVMKFDESGNLIYSTFLGGSNNDSINHLALDAAGNAYVVGYTSSSDFPVTSGAMQSTYAGGSTDGFVAVLSSDGSQLIYSTYLGTPGNDGAALIKSDGNGAFIIAGSSSAAGLPTTAGVYQASSAGPADAFFGRIEFPQLGKMKIDQLTYFGGSQSIDPTAVNDLTLDSAGNLYFAGQVQESTFPVTANALIKTFTSSGGCDVSSTPYSMGFITEMSSDFSKLIYSSYFGGQTEATANAHEEVGCAQRVLTVHVDTSGLVYLIGNTSESDFPVTANALRSQLNGDGGAGFDDFVSILKTDGSSPVYSSYLGGTDFEYSDTAAWDAENNIWIFGATDSTDYPVTSDALQEASGGGTDGTLTELSSDGTKILYSTYFGGSGNENQTGAHIAVDSGGVLHLSGSTSSLNLAITPTAFQPLFANGESAYDSTDIYFTLLGSGAIGTVGPIVGGNSGDTSITIDGAGFASGSTCQLVQGTTILSSATATINSSGTSINCIFALSGVATGSYDVVVLNPDGSSLTKSGGFTVESGGQPDLTVSILGRPIIRTGTPTTFYVNVTNTGSVNAYYAPLWLTSPVGVTFSVNSATQQEFVAFSSSDSTTAYTGVILPIVGAGQTVSVPMQITSPADTAAIPLSATLQPPWFTDSASMLSALSASTWSGSCIAGTNSYALNCFGPYFFDEENGVMFFTPTSGTTQPNSIRSLAVPRPNANTPCPNNPPGGFFDGVTAGQYDKEHGNPWGTTPNPNPANSDNAKQWAAGYAAGYIASSGPAGGSKSLPARGPALASLEIRPMDGETCPAQPPPNLPPPASSTPPSGSSIDPNYKAGPSGDNSKSAYVRGTSALNYSVGFENEATATLPASQVVVTDQLDPTKANLSTVSLGTISFGTNVITLPGGTSNYNTTYNINSSLSVRIQGSLNSNSGLLKWTFTSIDPSTGLPPTDPTIGFLPPDTDGIKGQGSVQFNVIPVAGQTTGTQITNMATVVFDTNAPINTPTWLNTLDVTAPTSSVTKLPTAETTSGATDTFAVNWSGTDTGSGIGTYSIYVSDNGGAFTPWQSSVTTTSASYTGAFGHTYGFYSIATDNAGNVEAAKTAADTSTTVAPPAPLPSTTTLTTSATSVASGTSVTLTAVVAPPSGTTTIPTGAVTFLNGTTALGMVTLDGTGTATYTTTTLPVGADSITAQYAGGAVFAGSTSSAVTVTVGNPSFSLALSAPSITVASGSSGSTTITATPSFGFGAAITFACSGLPANSTCSFSPASVTPTAGAAATTNLTIATGVTPAASVRHAGLEGNGLISEIIAAFILVPWGILMSRRRGSLERTARLFLLLLAAGTIAMIASCGGSSSNGGGGGSGPVTPAGTSTITLTATSGSTTQTTTVQLIVN
jgi:Bacterial Ig-like domain (group 3)/Beta-propeller repeat